MRETTKTVIAQMLQAGFKRSEFRCRIERFYRSQYAKEGIHNPYDYGSILIMVNGCFRDGVYVSPNVIIAERREAIIATGLGIQHLKFADGGEAYVIRAEYQFRGKIEVLDYARYGGQLPHAILEVCNA